MTAPDTVDYAHTEWANRKRREKAVLLAKHLYEQGVRTVDVLTMLTADKKAAEKACGVRTSHRDDLWDLVVVLLDERADWDDQHPPAPASAPQALPCGCPGAAVITDKDRHRTYHHLVQEQTSIAEGQVLNARSLQAARGVGGGYDVYDHKIQERHTRQGKHTSTETRRRLRA